MEARKATEALRSECDFGAVMDKAAMLVVNVLDREGRTVYVNQAAQEISGYTPQEVLGKRISDQLLPPEDVAGVEAVIRELLAERHPVRHANHWVSKDGQRHLIDWTATVMLDDRQEVEYFVGTGIEVKEQR